MGVALKLPCPPDLSQSLSTSPMSSSDLSSRAKLNYDSDKFTVEFNVAEYSPEDLHIKTEGDVLIVSAKQESKTSTGKSFVSKQFEQRFSLPSGVNPEKISSKLGVDGILRISAPREAGGHKKHEALEERHKSERSVANKQSDGLPEPRIKNEKDKLEVQIDVSEYKPEDLDVKVENNQLVISAKQETKEAGGGTRTRVFEQKFSLPPGVDPASVKSNLTRDNVLVVTAAKEGFQDIRWPQFLHPKLQSELHSAPGSGPRGCQVFSVSEWSAHYHRPPQQNLESSAGAAGAHQTHLNLNEP